MTTYLIIGYLVSLFFSCYYRLYKKTDAKQTDALAALIGILVWPLQIVLHLYGFIKEFNEK